MADLFAPPSDDEIKQVKKAPEKDLFAPPSREEVHGSWKDMKLPGGTAGGYVQGALNSLPSVGAMAGGAVGALGGEVLMPLGGGVPGGFAGAGLGGSVGGRLKSMGEQYLFDKNRAPGLGDMASGAKEGLVQEGTAGLLKLAGGSLANSGVQDIAQSFNRPGAEAVANAAAQLGVKPTQGMMTSDYLSRNLENSLSQNPSIPGALIRSEQAPIQKAIAGASENALADASGKSPLEGGREMQKGIAGSFEKRLEPIQDKYADIESNTKNIPLDQPKISAGIKRVSNNIRNLDEARFEGSDGHKVANQFADWLEQAKDANDLKLLKTKARQIAQDPNSSFEEKSVAGSIMGKLDQVQQNTIMRQAVQITRGEGPMPGSKILAPAREAAATADGQDLGRGLISDIKSTNKAYRGLMQDVQDFGKGSGLTKAKHGPSAALEDIRSANPQEMGSALFDAGNTDFTKMVKDKFPEQFELARQQRLSEISAKSQNPDGSVDSKKLLKIVGKMKTETPEALEMLFSPEDLKALDAADTLVKATPGKVGSSDTPRGLAFRDFLSPLQNLNDFGRYGLLKAKPSFPAVGNSVIRGARPTASGLMGLGRWARQGLMDIGLVNDDKN